MAGPECASAESSSEGLAPHVEVEAESLPKRTSTMSAGSGEGHRRCETRSREASWMADLHDHAATSCSSSERSTITLCGTGPRHGPALPGEGR
jgi:hypothetical protein